MTVLFRISCLVPLMVLVAHSNIAGAGDHQLRITEDETELRFWLENMVWYHRYVREEITQVTGLDESQLKTQLMKFNISEATRPPRNPERLLLLPYPGGRHPRIGFLEGAVEPQRETKLSVFCPWDDHSYVVMDVPEAIWSNLGLTYLAHTHVTTIWEQQGAALEQQEWQRNGDGSFQMQRRLPNGIEFGTTAKALSDHIAMTMFLKNGTDQPLSDLRVQNCVMLKGAEGFDQQTNENKVFTDGYAVARSANGDRWIITGWDPLHRAWGNKRCPCLHADPKFPDCDPGETRYLRGWLSFYEGADIAAELQRIESTGWRHRSPDGSGE
ncbi:MAG: hypothetical protein KDB01_20110 [Planctomycetaceae bacterium]|nr:hypothetical protein [Planctomycetaceae bacterium]